MIRKMVGWMKNNPALICLIVVILIQTIMTTMIFMWMFPFQEALRELVLKLSPPYPTYRF